MQPRLSALTKRTREHDHELRRSDRESTVRPAPVKSETPSFKILLQPDMNADARRVYQLVRGCKVVQILCIAGTGAVPSRGTIGT